MLNWIRTQLQQFIFKDITVKSLYNWDEEDEEEVNTPDTVSLPDPLIFKVQVAQGGTIVEVQAWDSKNDEYNTKMHVIPEGGDIADTVGKIVVMEMLRR
jgi:hypothetical protein